jgi:hypothetical protein
MSLKEVSITGPNNVRALVTGQEELLVKVNSFNHNANFSGSVKINDPIGQQPSDNSVSTTLATEQANVMITPTLSLCTGNNGDASGSSVLSISFASIGTADALVSTNGGATYINLAPGTTVSFDAGGVMNYYNGSNFMWDATTNAGSSLLVAVNYI